jgi:hypothetical protein
MFFSWGLPLRRPTRDMDSQGKTANTTENLIAIFRDICTLDPSPPDGMEYDPDSLRGEEIVNDADYPGIRLTLWGYLGTAKIQVQVDISFTSVITPHAIQSDYPTLLDMPPFPIQGYPYETTIAEKLQAMVFLDIINDRMKDFYDIWLLAQNVEINGPVLVEAIRNTFRARGTAIPIETPTALTSRFAEEKRKGWAAFLKKLPAGDPIPSDFLEVLQMLRAFLIPVLEATASEQAFEQWWKVTERWK